MVVTGTVCGDGWETPATICAAAMDDDKASMVSDVVVVGDAAVVAAGVEIVPFVFLGCRLASMTQTTKVCPEPHNRS